MWCWVGLLRLPCDLCGDVNRELQQGKKLNLLVAGIQNNDVAGSACLHVFPGYGVLVKDFLEAHAVVSLSVVSDWVIFSGSIFSSHLTEKSAQPVTM